MASDPGISPVLAYAAFVQCQELFRRIPERLRQHRLDKHVVHPSDGSGFGRGLARNYLSRRPVAHTYGNAHERCWAGKVGKDDRLFGWSANRVAARAEVK